MRIIITGMLIENFKGIKKLEVPFDPKKTILCGRNETCKTTVADAFYWVLFGKDSEFRTKFDIIPLDKNNKAIHHLNTLVEVSLNIDKEVHVLKRILSENWVKKQGVDEEKRLTGTSTEFFVDESPVKKAEYEMFVDGIVEEVDFKLLTSISYFNEVLDWQERRKILTGLIKSYSHDDIVTQKGFAQIREEILQSGVEKVEEKYKYQKREIQKAIEDIPPRIDEVSKTINADPIEGVKEYQEKRSGLIAKINDLKTKSNEKFLSVQEKLNKQIKDINERINSSDSDTGNIDALQKSLDGLILEKSDLVSSITTLSKEIKDIKDRSNNLISNREGLKEKYIHETETTFPEESLNCILCGQPLPRNKLMEAKEKFAELKQKTIDDLTRQAGQVKEAIQLLAKQLEDKNAFLKQKQDRIDSLISSISDSEEIIKDHNESGNQNKIEIDLKAKKEEIETELRNLSSKFYTEEMETYQNEIDSINQKIGTFEGSQRAKDRLTHLEDELKEHNSQLLNIEKKLDLIEKLKIKYIETIEGDINNLFDRKIQVRLFEYQINGGFKEACDILVANRIGVLVPWQYANTAGQINSALQIINQLSKHKDIYCPVFVDHTESVDPLYKMDTQMIELKFLATFVELEIK